MQSKDIIRGPYGTFFMGLMGALWDVLQIISFSCFCCVFVLLPRKARTDALGVLLMKKDLMHISELEKICPEVTRRTLQRDLNNLIESNLVRLSGAARQSNYEPAK